MGGRLLFDQCTFGITDQSRIGIVGVNGCGKSTLLKLIAGVLPPDAGEIARRSNLDMRFLAQTPRFDPRHSIIEHLLGQTTPITQLLRRYHELCDRIHEHDSGENQRALDAITERMHQTNAWTYEQQLRAMLGELGIANTDMRMGELSGGMVKKTALAQVFLGNPELLLLDEPTNHLDIDTADWLHDTMQRSGAAIALVTHDRSLLESVCDTIYEIDHHKLYSFSGGYSGYLSGKTTIEQAHDAAERRLKAVLTRELQWLGQTPQARTGKQKARIDRVRGMLAQCSTSSGQTLSLGIQQRRMGKKVLEAHAISKSFDGRPVIKPFSRIFSRKERIGIVGPNGSGKTTFIHLLTGALQPDSGSVERGANTHFGLFAQDSRAIAHQQSVLDVIRTIAEQVVTPDGSTVSAGAFLERFLFPRSMHHTPVEKLSGGERRRLHLVSVLIENPNFLVLDEPTNDLDIQTLSVLEDFCRSFSGCMITVSHDRYFMDRVVDSLFIFDGRGGISEFPGSYSDYLLFRKEMRETRREKRPKQPSAAPLSRPPKKLSYNEERELSQLESEIESLESRKADYHDRLCAGQGAPDELARWGTDYANIEAELEMKIERWTELETKKEDLDRRQ
jgi:ATP-binding cassette subfamily F protein uup